MTLTLIGIVNAILWSGVLLYMLARLMRGQQKIEARLARLEHEQGKEDGARSV